MKQLYNYQSSIIKHLVLPILFLLLTAPTYGRQLTQEWSKVYKQAAGNAHIIVGFDSLAVVLSDGTNLVGFDDPAITKINKAGEVLWKYQFEEEDFDFREPRKRFAQDTRSNNYVLGNSVMKFSPDGQLLWQHDLKQYSFTPEMIAVEDLGPAYVVGKTDSSLVALRLDNSGELDWIKTIPIEGELSEDPILVVKHYLFIGYTRRIQNSADFVTLHKFESHTGNLLSSLDIKANLRTQHYSLQDLHWLRNDDMYMFVNSSPATHTKIFKINAASSEIEVLWETTYHTEQRNYYADVAFDAPGNMLLLTSAQFSGRTPTFGYVVAKISNAGRILWHRPYEIGTDLSPDAEGIILQPDGRAIVAGTTTDANGRSTVAIQHYSALGDVLSTVYYHTTDTSQDYALAVAKDLDQSFYFVGGTRSTENSADGSELVIARYRATGCTTPDLIVAGGFINCKTNTAQLTASSSVAGLSYSWTGPDGFTSTEQNPVVSEPGNYIVTVSTGMDCINTATVNVLPASTTSACYTIDFENENLGLLSSTQTQAGTVALFGWNRWSNGYAPENHAAIFDTGMPTGDDDDLHTLDWGKALIINENRFGEPNDNRTGGMLDIDFSVFGPVTLQSLKVLDIDEYEDDCWVYLYDAAGNELFKTHLQPLGNNSQQTIDLGNTRNVMKMRIVLAGTEGDVGSGAIDDIKFCVEEVACEEPESENTLAAYAAPTLFSDKTIIAFEASEAAPYTVTLHDLRGNLIGELATGTTIAGETKEVKVDGTALPNGMYIARIISGSQSKAVKLILRR